MNNIQETLFRTIETITDSKLNQIKFDKTIEAIVLSDEKASSGEYDLRYQDLIFKAYASNNTSKYKKEENVLVLVPDGDMSNRKTIISSNKKEGEAYVDIEHIVDKVGINFVDEADNYEIYLSTTSDETVDFKIKKQAMVDMYPGKKFLSIGADIYTNINPSDIDGLYGIAVDCMFLNDEGERIPHTFEFNTLNVTGNPFQARGYKEVQIPLLKERLVEVVSARAFSKGFSAGHEKIKMRNLVVEYVNIREQDKSEYSANIIAPKGTHFRSNSLYPDEKLELIMEFKQSGAVLNTDAISYKWFVLNGEVVSVDDPKYHPDAGLGWEWLKDSNYEEDELKGSNSRVLSVGATFVPNFSTFKCVAHYEKASVSVSDMATLIDHTESLDIEIISDNGVSFVNGAGSTNLICNVTKNNKAIEGVELEYEWSRVKSNKEVELIQKGASNKISVLANTIGEKSTYLCEVSIKNGKRPISTGHITLINVIDGATQGLVIVGGFRAVLYDGEGKAPENLVKDGFQFDLYSNGEKVTSNIDWVWKIPPKEKTLLTLENAVIDNRGYQTTKNKVLNLGVDKNFNYAKNENIIELEVQHTINGIVTTLKEFATISITKMGQNGADGAAGQSGLDGKTYVYQIMGGNPTIIYDKNGENPSPRELSPFELMFSVDGDSGLAKEVEQVTWTIQSQKESIVSFAGEDRTRRSIVTRKKDGVNSNPHVVRLVADEKYSLEKYNNILTAEITYKEMTFRETYPISVVKNGTDGLYGLTISLNPNNYNIDAESDGNIVEDVSLLLNFDIYRSNNKIENYRITSVGGVPEGMTYRIEGNSLRVTFLRGRSLPDNGVIEIDLEVEGSPSKQSFTFSKTRNGDSPYLMFLQSTNGLVFKRGDISTIVYAVVMRGADIITDTIEPSAFMWEKIDKSGNRVERWSPSFVDDRRDKIIVTPDDILERATFNCSLNL